MVKEKRGSPGRSVRRQDPAKDPGSSWRENHKDTTSKVPFPTGCPREERLEMPDQLGQEDVEKQVSLTKTGMSSQEETPRRGTRTRVSQVTLGELMVAEMSPPERPSWSSGAVRFSRTSGWSLG